MKESNYEKTKKEGIEEFDKIWKFGVDEKQRKANVKYFIDSFAEKIKEAVVADCVDIISDSRTVEEFLGEGVLECKVRGKAIADISAKYSSPT